MDQYLERRKLSKFTRGEIENLSRRVSMKEIKLIINNLPKKKAPDPYGFPELYQIFKQEFI